MTSERFDDPNTALAGASSRRGVLRLLAGGAAAGALAGVGVAQADARRKKARKPKPAKGNNPFTGVNVSGVGENGKKVFVGKLEVAEFVAEGETLLAVGTVSGRLTRNNKPRTVEDAPVRLPVTAINGVDLATLGGDEAAASGVSAQQLACEILTLTLGPLDLDLLGLRVQLNQVELDVTAIPGGGLLGDLLCAVANLLGGGGPLAGLLTQIAGLLNQILGLFG